MYKNKEGKSVLRVSSIVKMITPEELIYWANYLGFKNISYKKELNNMANVGSMIHDLIYKLNSRKLVRFDWDEYEIYEYHRKQAVLNGLESFKKWKEANIDIFKVYGMEYTIIGDKYGGAIDLILESPFNDDAYIVADYKTSKDFRFSHFLQLAGYVSLCEKIKNMKIDAIMVILINKDGRKAKERLILREDLDLFIALFEYLYAVKVMNMKLESRMKTITKELKDL